MRSEARRWVKALMSRHIKRLALTDAPEDGDEVYEDAALVWDEALEDAGANHAEAERASRRVVRNPPSWWREQLPAILAAIEAERLANPAQTPDMAPRTDRETAMAASARCEWCEGSGLATVYHRLYDGGATVEVPEPDGSTRTIKARVSVACCCPFGRWILARNQNDPKAARALGGIEAVIEGRSDYLGVDPRTIDGHGEPPRDWRKHAADWAEKSKRSATRRSNDAGATA